MAVKMIWGAINSRVKFPESRFKKKTTFALFFLCQHPSFLFCTSKVKVRLVLMHSLNYSGGPITSLNSTEYGRSFSDRCSTILSPTPLPECEERRGEWEAKACHFCQGTDLPYSVEFREVIGPPL